MADTTDFLINEMEERWRQARQAEDQRTNVTNLIVIIASIIQGALTQTGFRINALPLTLLLFVLGIYGALASAKLYERFTIQVNRIEAFEKRLNELHPDAHIEELRKESDNNHYSKYPILGGKIRLHRIWLGLHILIAILGATYTLIILFH